MSGNSVEKILVITKRECVELVVNQTLKNTNIVFVKTIDEAIEKIVANGFSTTIIDCKMNFPKNVKIDDLIKLNYTACKCTILIDHKNTKRLIKKILGKLPEDTLIWNISDSNLDEEIKKCFKERNLKKPKTQDEMFEDIYNGIKEAKNGWFIKNPNFMII